MQREGVANVVNWLIISIHASQHRMRRHHSRHDHFPFIISIHAPIVGCDQCHLRLVLGFFDFNPRTHRGVRPSGNFNRTLFEKFQSTHPSWGATNFVEIDNTIAKISIHAPILGCDACLNTSLNCNFYFNPRTHRGVRRRG